MTVLKKGFTLIELLIVMAILGVLAVVVLVAINPAEQMRRARDTGKVSGVNQLGRAIQAYYTANGTLPAETGWGATLTTSQELSAIPSGITADGSTACTGGVALNSTWCYVAEGDGGSVDEDQFVIFARLFSQQRDQQCEAVTSGGNPWALFSATASRGGFACSSGEPAFDAVPDI